MDIFWNKLKAEVKLYEKITWYSIANFIDAWNALTTKEIELDFKEKILLDRENNFDNVIKLAEDRAEAKWEKEWHHHAHLLAEKTIKDNNELMHKIVQCFPKASDITINK